MVLLKTLAHQILSQKVNVGDIVIDATTGNGNDTLLLARKVGATGRVFGFDIQPKAITATTKRLTSMYNLDGVTLIQACHTLMPSFIPQEYHGRVKAITFNLGYLPGGDPQIITQPLITCQAIQGAITLLAPTGIITILAYQGHEGGSDEISAIAGVMQRLSDQGFLVRQHTSPAPGPILFLLSRESEATAL